MTQAIGNERDAFSEMLSYDKHGNILNISRNGIDEHDWGADGITSNHTSKAVDCLDYYYNGNQLMGIGDSGDGDQWFTGGQDFKNSTNSGLCYDGNGSMAKNLCKNITTIKYNYLNLPDTVQMGSGHMVTYGYDATGTKTFAIHRTATGSSVTMPIGSTLMHNTVGYTVASSANTMYLDNMVYKIGYSYFYAVNNILIPDGILIRSNPLTDYTPTFTYHYYLKDHLGNNRVVFHDGGGDSAVIDQVSNYYPFGMEYGESAEDQAEMTFQDYQFGGKEFDRKFELNMYNFGARE